MPTVESLVPKHRMPVTLHGGVMARDQLRDQHSLDLVTRLYANNSGERRLCLTPPLIEIVGLTPQNISDLINEEVGEIGTVGAADRPRITAMLSEGGNFADYYLCPRRRSFSRRCGSLGRSRSGARRSEEHTSELQSHLNLVCRLLLEKKKTNNLNDVGRMSQR